jgi:hypothetical protein
MSSMRHSVPLPIAAVGGSNFIAYAGKGDTVFLERLRPNGARDGKSIFQFDAAVLLAALLEIAFEQERDVATALPIEVAA